MLLLDLIDLKIYNEEFFFIFLKYTITTDGTIQVNATSPVTEKHKSSSEQRLQATGWHDKKNTKPVILSKGS